MNQQLIFKIFFIPVVLIIILFSFISTTSAQENNEIIATVRISICGNGIIEEGEICDSANLNNLTCKDIGYITGELKCSISCDEYETLLCSNISGDLWYDLFRYCPNVETLKDTFNGTRVSGIFFSRTSDYSSSDNSTFGLLDFIPKLTSAESSFAKSVRV
mgnify:CR=1 FL=1